MQSLRENRKAEFQEVTKLDTSHISKSDNRDFIFQFAYAEVSATENLNIEEGFRMIVERSAVEKLQKRVQAIKERDFGTTVLYTETKKTQLGPDGKVNCCN